MGVDNAGVVRRFMNEVLVKGDLGLIDELADDNIVVRDTMGTDIKGKDKLKELVKSLRTVFTDNAYDIEEVIVAGDRVVVRYTWRGTHRGEFFGIPATGRTISGPSVDVLRVVNGKIAEDLQYIDTYDLIRQLGVLPHRDKLSKSTQAQAQQARA